LRPTNAKFNIKVQEVKGAEYKSVCFAIRGCEV
jgi:hypothetical protein